MKREIKNLELLKIQADYLRLGRIEQIIVEALIKKKVRVFIPSDLLNDFVESKLKDSGYNVVKGISSFLVELE